VYIRPEGGTGTPGSAPPTPERGASLIAPGPRRYLEGAELNTLALRAPTLIGRTQERDVLWAALREVRETWTSGALLPRGPLGTGTSTLARWLIERAHELGAATSISSIFDPEMDPFAELASAARASLPIGHRDLRGDALARRLTETHATELPGATPQLAAWMLSDDDARAEMSVKLERVDQGIPALWRLVSSQAHRAGRALVWWCDDLHHAPTMDALIAHALEAPDAPVLFVGTWDPSSDEGPSWADHARATLVDVSPMPDLELREMVTSRTHLRAELVEELVRRAEGLPGYVEEVLEQDVRRGALVAGPSGLELERGMSLGLPSSIADATRQALLEHLEHAGAPAAHLLEARAALPPWATTAQLDAVLDDGLIDMEHALTDLEVAGFIRRGPREARWSLARPEYRVALREESERMDRWSGLRARVARALEGDDTLRASTWRIACLIDAGDDARARELAMASMDAAKVHPSTPLLATFLVTLEGLDDARTSTLERAKTLEAQVKLAQRQEHFDQAREDAERAIGLLDALTSPPDDARATQARLLNQLGTTHFMAGDFASAITALERSAALHDAVGDPLSAHGSRIHLGLCIGYSNDLGRGVELMEASIAEFERLGALSEVAKGLSVLSGCVIQDRPEDAVRFAERSMELAPARVSIHDEAMIVYRAVGTFCAVGDWPRAQRALDRSEELFTSLGKDMSGLHTRQLWVWVAVGEYGRVLDVQASVRRRIEARGRRFERVTLDIFSFAAHCGSEQWDEARDMLANARSLLEESPSVRFDHGWGLEEGASLAEGQGQWALARDALDAARAIWAYVEAEEELERVDASLARIAPYLEPEKVTSH